MNHITTNSFWTFKLWIVNSQSDVTTNAKKDDEENIYINNLLWNYADNIWTNDN